MKNILVLGAGQSAPYMISYLLDKAAKNDWFITVGDIDLKSAKKAINRHPKGNAISFNVNDSEMRWKQVENARDLVAIVHEVEANSPENKKRD